MDKIIRRPPKMKLIGIERWSYLEPPKFKRIFPPEIPGATSDWDFGSVPWQLDTSTYVSSPSSLKITRTGTLYPILCKYSGTTNISQGQIVNYAKAGVNWGGSYAPRFYFFFRNQTALGATPSNSSGYDLYIDTYYSDIGVEKDGATFLPDTSILSKPSDISQWNKFRLTWWTDPGGAGLMIRIEYWDGSQWVKMINDVNDPQNKYASSSLNRVGITGKNGNAWFDDTEIWSA
jgi:hypothetical protein